MFLSRASHVVILGDMMLDHHRYVSVQRIANEAPIPIFHLLSETYSLGGSGNVVKNMKALGCTHIDVFGIVGDDTEGDKIKTLLNTLNVQSFLQTRHIQTTCKERTFCENKIIFRCDKEEQSFIDIDVVLLEFELQIRNDTIVVLSDYNKGFLSSPLCESIIRISKKYHIPVYVDPKCDIQKYKGCTLIKPNLNEARLLLHCSKHIPILTIHQRLHEETECVYSVVTMSEKGITLYDGITLYHEQPTIQHQLIDVTGAGDIVCSILATYLGVSSPNIQEILRLATRIATRSVESPGTYTIQPRDIIEFELQHTKQLTMEQLSWIRTLYPYQKLVFTNGCFDLLHHGHLSLLHYCHSKGDIVLVGLNSDASIKRLKGDTRPIHSLDIRLALLSAVQWVHHIIVFEEDSPYSLLESLRPDVIVKGGDYQINDIIGREFAKEVYVCNLIPNISSSKIIESIQSIANPNPNPK